MKINRNRASMIPNTFFFTIENIYERYIVLLVQHYTNTLPPDGVHPQISSFLRLLVLCLVRSVFFVIHNRFFSFSSNLLLPLPPLTNATPVFSALWYIDVW